MKPISCKMLRNDIFPSHKCCHVLRTAFVEKNLRGKSNHQFKPEIFPKHTSRGYLISATILLLVCCSLGPVEKKDAILVVVKGYQMAVEQFLI